MNIDDVTLHPDAIHRGSGQIILAAKKVTIEASNKCDFNFIAVTQN